MAVLGPRPELYRWRRFTTPARRTKPKFDADNVEHWIKRVEQASEFAVSAAFSSKKASYAFHGPVLDLETTEQLQDHDKAYEEAQELLNDWVNTKLKLELVSDQEDDSDKLAARSVLPQDIPVGFQKYEKFDDLYSYLEQEMESNTVQDFLQHLLQSKVVDNGILKDLKIEDRKEKRKPMDPRITMELRHKQVKENRLRRQKELDHLKQEKALKKYAMSEAQKQLQEENKKRFLEARREEEEIQRQMVKLRKEMVEKRHLMDEARKMERKRHELKQIQRLVDVGPAPTLPTFLSCEKEEQRKAKEVGLQELLSNVAAANHKCLQKCFSAWYKLLLDLRVKMGKARALADWKCELKALRAWRDYVRAQRLEQEAQKMEKQLRDQNRKNQLATEFDRKCLLRRCFAEWQCWSQAEVEKRALQLKKEETRRKVAKLLEEMTLGQLSKAPSKNAEKTGETEGAQEQLLSHKEVADVPLVQEEPTTAEVERAHSYSPEKGQKVDLRLPKQPKWAWQVSLKHAARNVQDHAVFGKRTRSSKWSLGTHSQKMAPALLGSLEHRHAFQQQLIEEQRQKLQEQQKLILELQENQRLKGSRDEAEQARAVPVALDNPTPQSRDVKQSRGHQSDYKIIEPLRSQNHQPAAQSRKNPKVLSSPHPFLKAMEERAIQRAERKRELEEAKKKREDEKLAQMKAEEEERQQQEKAEKEAQLEKKREEKRLQKMKELEKQRRLARGEQLLSKAIEHYNKVLLKHQGLEPWKKLMQQSQQYMMVAQNHHCFGLQRKCLLAWHQHAQETLARKTAQAEELHSHLILRRSFKIWIKYKTYSSALEENANKLYEISLKKKFFWAWFDVFNEEKSALWEKQKIADKYSERRITVIAFRAWRRLPTLMKEERLREERLERLRRRVSEILPDFRM